MLRRQSAALYCRLSCNATDYLAFQARIVKTWVLNYETWSKVVRRVYVDFRLRIVKTWVLNYETWSKVERRVYVDFRLRTRSLSRPLFKEY